MQIKGCVAFVSGANRGLGACFVEKLLEQGAHKVYAGVRDIGILGSSDSRVVPIELDIARPNQVAKRSCAGR